MKKYTEWNEAEKKISEEIVTTARRWTKTDGTPDDAGNLTITWTHPPTGLWREASFPVPKGTSGSDVMDRMIEELVHNVAETAKP